MRFTEELEPVAEPIWEAILEHPMVTRLGEGTLDEPGDHRVFEDRLPDRLRNRLEFLREAHTRWSHVSGDISYYY